jgi:hypothetical protein
MIQSAVSAKAAASQYAVQPGESARFGPITHECREGSQVENSRDDDWGNPEGAGHMQGSRRLESAGPGLRRVDGAFEECTDDCGNPEGVGYMLGSRRLESAGPGLRRVDSTELPTMSNGNAQGEWDSPRNQHADSCDSFGTSVEGLRGIPPKSMGKSLSLQVLGDDDRGLRGVH